MAAQNKERDTLRMPGKVLQKSTICKRILKYKFEKDFEHG